jgi:hypothetical protein
MVELVVPFKHSFIPTAMGINETCLTQYELAKETDHKEILFAECDYYWRPGSGKALLEAISSLQLVSPYDHRNFYIDRAIHSEDCKIKLVGDQHWRSTERNTMTFGITKDAFTKLFNTFLYYGYLDNEVWHESREKGYRLWVPIPSLATHMAKDWLAPSIDWKGEWEKYV